MKQTELQNVMLVKAIEETDRNGVIISAEQGERATLKALMDNGLPQEGPPTDVSEEKLSSAISDRSALLLKDVIADRPVLDDLLAISSWRRWIVFAVLASAVSIGIGMSAIPDQMNILDLSYIGVIVWNLLIYLLLLLGMVLHVGNGGPGISRLLGVAAKWVEHRLTMLLAESAQSDDTIAAIGRRFFEVWRVAAGPVFAQRVKVLLHVAAACMALGLIGGLYSHLWDEHHDVVWESSLLNAPDVKRLIDATFSAPAAVLGFELPASVNELEKLERTSSGVRGAAAKPWIHLFSLVLVCLVVVPRLFLAGTAGMKSGWLQRPSYLPDIVRLYALSVLGDKSVARAIIHVFPYELDPSVGLTERLDAYLLQRMGRGARGQVHSVIVVGEEHAIEKLSRGPIQRAAGWLILTRLESKPDSATHGIMVVTARDVAASALPVRLLVDEHVEPTSWVPDWWRKREVDRRRRQWRQFASTHRIEVGFLAG